MIKTPTLCGYSVQIGDELDPGTPLDCCGQPMKAGTDADGDPTWTCGNCTTILTGMDGLVFDITP